MKFKVIAAAAALALATPALAKDISLPLTEQEQQGLASVLDQAVRSGGIQAAPNAIYFFNKLQNTVSAATAAPPSKPAEIKPDVPGGASATPAEPSAP